MNNSNYATKNAIFYTTLVTAILLLPLFLYFIYMKNVISIQNELFLKEKSLLIIETMEEFNQNDEYFEYPRFKTFESGLYNARFEPIFSLIDSKITNFKDGYFLEGNDALLIIELPRYKYFDASYLILHNEVSYASLYKNISIILFSIVLIIFFLSLLFLNSFARPFTELNKQLDNFIKDSIHEINTPLSIINVNIDLYKRKHEENKYFQRIKTAAKVLSGIYDDMDYLIKHNHVEYIDEEIDFSDFVKRRIEYFLDVATLKNISIHQNIEEGIVVRMNSKKLRRLVDNSISNAIKYSLENESILVKLYMHEGSCYFSVQDSGIGIENVDKIFNRYYREEKNKGGFGIGLNIVQSIINEYDIDVEIDSEPHKGSTFTYRYSKNLLVS